jgi:hypothetical protein
MPGAERTSRPELDEELCQELETIGYELGRTASPEERLARWWSLFDKAGRHKGVHMVNLADAERLIGWGWTLAMIAGQYREAYRLLEPLFQHPDLAHASELDRGLLNCKRATSLLFSGEVSEAVSIYHAVLGSLAARPGHARSIATRLWGDLEEWCTKQSGDKTAPPALRKLVFDVVCRLSRRIRRVAPRYEPREGATCGELGSLLRMVYEGGRA